MKGPKKLLPIEVKLALLNETARRIYFIIKQEPGIQHMEVYRAVGLSSDSSVRHHVDRLKREGLIMELKERGFGHFFVVGDHDRRLCPVISRFSRPVPRHIAELLLEGPMSQGEIAQKLSFSAPALSYHLKQMMASGDLERRHEGVHAIYSLLNPELVCVVLAGGHYYPAGPEEATL